MYFAILMNNYDKKNNMLCSINIKTMIKKCVLYY